jgi:hypothetical protein
MQEEYKEITSTIPFQNKMAITSVFLLFHRRIVNTRSPQSSTNLLKITNVYNSYWYIDDGSLGEGVLFQWP